MPPLPNTSRPAFTDLVDLVQLTNTPDEARTAVVNYLSKFAGTCPTNRCPHDLEQAPFLCKNYRSRWHTFQIIHGELKDSASDGYALSTDEICSVLDQTGDPGKDRCRECKASDWVTRGKLDGVYCHGCGFFIDFGRKQIGYTQEWTVSEGTEPPFPLMWGKKCSNCAKPDVKAKFADYFFCSQVCMDQWLLGPSKAML